MSNAIGLRELETEGCSCPTSLLLRSRKHARPAGMTSRRPSRNERFAPRSAGLAQPWHERFNAVSVASPSSLPTTRFDVARRLVLEGLKRKRGGTDCVSSFPNGRADGLKLPMGMSLSGSVSTTLARSQTDTCRSIERSWPTTLAGRSEKTSRFTTSMETGRTIGWKTSSFERDSTGRERQWFVPTAAPATWFMRN